MAFKDIFKNIKEENKKKEVISNNFKNNTDKFIVNKNIKDAPFDTNIKLELSTKKEINNFYTIKKNDTLKLISKSFYNDENKWIMIHLANYDKIKNPLILLENTKIYIPKNNEFNNHYNEYDAEYNYIIQEKDNLKIISKKIFGDEKLYKKLIDWNFFKKAEDIYPSKIVYGLKYKSYDYQINNINKKYFNLNKDNKSILINYIIKQSKKYNLSPAPILLVSNLEDTFLKSENINLNYNYWGIFQISEEKYINYFPYIVFSIEENINFALENIRKIKSEAKNWPKTIIDYFLLEGIGKGKPEIQKEKAKEAIDLIKKLLIKLENMNIKELEDNYKELINSDNISFSLLNKELKDYCKFIETKYS